MAPSLVKIASSEVSIEIAPSLGGRMVELTDIRRGRQWLWRNPGIDLGPVPPDSSYDDVWQGGFEELFPNDAPDETYPDHGELWSVPWQITHQSATSVELSVTGRVTSSRVTKRFTVLGASTQVAYRIEYGGEDRLDHMFKLHPALAVNDRCRIELPGGLVEQVDPSFGNILGSTLTGTWSELADQLSVCQDPQTKTREFVYVSDLPEGWCAVSDFETGARLRIDYPRGKMPFCWIFIAYGGWRGHNVVVLEPCTNYPKDLGTAVARGSSARIEPGGVVEYTASMTVGGLS